MHKSLVILSLLLFVLPPNGSCEKASRGELKKRECISDMQQRCMFKKELGVYGIFVQGGDPCFIYHGGRWCFVARGSLHPCTCTLECGCFEQGLLEEDNRIVASCPSDQGTPKAPNCAPDKAKYCPLGTDNTMCKFCGVSRTSCGNGYCTHGLTDAQKETLLDQHNALRSKVARGHQEGQPPAANMKKLKWSEELARIAQRWANQCPRYHDPNRKSPNFVHEPGQNIANSWSSINSQDWSLPTKLQSWFDEVHNFPARSVMSFSNQNAKGTIGHYTQLVWGETEFVGCGAIYYRDPQAPNYPFRKTLICNYHPPGNYLGRPVYLIGEPGSACGNGFVENGLCV